MTRTFVMFYILYYIYSASHRFLCYKHTIFLKHKESDRIDVESFAVFQKAHTGMGASTNTARKRVQTNTQRFKEDLMRNRWHPDRMDAYLEMGLDLADM